MNGRILIRRPKKCTTLFTSIAPRTPPTGFCRPERDPLNREPCDTGRIEYGRITLVFFSSKMMRGALRSSRVVRLDWVALGNKVTSDAGKLELANLRAAYSGELNNLDSFLSLMPRQKSASAGLPGSW